MSVAVHVSLAPGPIREQPTAPCTRLLEPCGARVILGGCRADTLAAPIVAAADTLFGPRGVCAGPDGSIWVSDTGHHRVLGWRRAPGFDQQGADLLIGQPAYDREGRNAQGPVSARTLNVPTGIAVCGAGLAVADAWNHRVLLWHRRPQTSNELPDVVLGQEDFAQGTSNRGWSEPRADTLFWPYCVSWDGGHLWVADSGNRRVLMWDGLPQANGAPADLVLGQAEFRCRDENAGHHPDRASMRWPHAIAFPNGGLCIADAGNNRLMLWHRQPLCNFAGCDAVLGQADLRTVEHNRGRYSPDARSLNMPYGATVAGRWLAVADTANSRLLAWNLDRWPALDPDARALAAQANWSAKGDNRWQAPARDSVCWPYCVAVDGVHLLIADSGNNRILLWRLNAATH